MLLTDLKITVSSEGELLLPFDANLTPLIKQLEFRILNNPSRVTSEKSLVNQIPRAGLLKVLKVVNLDKVGQGLFWLALLEVFFVRIVNAKAETDTRSVIVQHFRSLYVRHARPLLLELALQQTSTNELSRGQLKLATSAWLAVSLAHVGFLVLLENFPLNAPELLALRDGVVSRLAAFMHAEINAPATLSLATALSMSNALYMIFPPVLVDLNRSPLDGTTQRSSTLKELLSLGRSDEVMTGLWRRLTNGEAADKSDVHDISGILTMKRPHTEGSMRSLGLSRIAESLIPGEKLKNRSKMDDVTFRVNTYRESNTFADKAKPRAQSAPAEAKRVARRASGHKRRLALSSSADVQNAIAFEDTWIPPPGLEAGLNLYNVSPASYDSRVAKEKLDQRLNKTLNLSKNGSFTTYLQNFDMFGNPRRVPMKLSSFNTLPDMNVELYEKEELARDMKWKNRLWNSYK